MAECIKAGDMSGRYGVSTRTLRYYEEMGLIQSRRTSEYAYRTYDDANVKRLEQILILRKLHIGIRDIQRIFSTPGSEVVLEVLGKKADDTDEEIALLRELKEIVTDFIRQIEKADFSRASDVKLLYDKAKELETQLGNTGYAGNPSPAHRLFEVAEKLEEKAAFKLSIPENILKRLLQNVYFILGDGAEVADELGRRYGIFVYHTCHYRHTHHQNADLRFQPYLGRFAENFFAQDPEDALRREQGIVRDFTPMVIMDLIQLTAKHEKIICENNIDVESILPIITHAVDISSDKPLDDFIARYESEIRSRTISEEEKEQLIRKVNKVWVQGKPENPRGTNLYGIKEIFIDEALTVTQTADMVAMYFGFSRV